MEEEIWKNYSDGEILDEVMKKLEADDITGLFNRIDEILVHPWYRLNSNKEK